MQVLLTKHRFERKELLGAFKQDDVELIRKSQLTECCIGCPLPTGFPDCVSNKWITKEKRNNHQILVHVYIVCK